MGKSTNTTDIAVLQAQTADIRVDVKEIKEHYLTKEEFNDKFEPVRKIVYGVVSVILLSVLGVAGTAINFFLKIKP